MEEAWAISYDDRNAYRPVKRKTAGQRDSWPRKLAIKLARGAGLVTLAIVTVGLSARGTVVDVWILALLAPVVVAMWILWKRAHRSQAKDGPAREYACAICGAGAEIEEYDSLKGEENE